MTNFDNTPLDIENHFHKNNPQLLEKLFGNPNVQSFWIADMDFQIAPAISQEIQRISQRGVYAYEFNGPMVFDAIAQWNNKRHKLHLNSQHFVPVNGVLTGISLLIQELTQKGDGVIIQTPVYHKFADIINSTNRKIIENPLQLVNGKYQMDLKDFEQKCQLSHAKLMILCNPHNPIGRVWTKEELSQLIDIANKYDIQIISDEIHSEIVYPGHTFHSILSFDSTNHIALIGSPAKTFGMQSFANGYIYIPNDTIRQQMLHKAETLFLNHGNILTNYATIAAYNHGEEWLEDLLVYLKQTIEWIDDFLKKELPNVRLIQPEGTYQIWLDFSDLNLSNKKLNDLLVNKAQIALAPGLWFGKNGRGFMRMNIASPLFKIQKAFKAISQAINTP